MATPLLGLYAPADGSDANAWGHNFVNGLATTLDNVIASFQAIGLSSGTVGLSSAQAGAQMLRLTGSLSGNVTITNGGNLWNGIRCVENLTTGAFTVSLSQAGASYSVPQNARALVYLDPTGGVRPIAQINVSQVPDMPSGTVASFYQNSAPAGWTISSSLNDYGMRIVSSNGGGVNLTGQAYSTNFSRTSTGSYTLQIADIPSHNHTVTGEWLGHQFTGFTNGFTSLQGGGFTASTDLDIHEPPTGNTGGGGAHSHSLIMTVRTADFILATKN